MKITPAWRVYILGAILLISLTICSRHYSSRGAPSFMIPLAVAGIAYLLAIREFFSTPKFPKRAIIIGLGLAAVWQLLFLRLPPGPDDDIHRYLWDGRVQRLGYNPYTVVPSDPALAGLHTPETRTLNHPDLPSPYPPGAQLFFRAVTAIHESVFALKVAFVVCDWAIVFVLLDVLRRSGQGAHWVLAYAWHPLLATEVAGSGHIDIVGALLLLISVAALARGRGVVADAAEKMCATTSAAKEVAEKVQQRSERRPPGLKPNSCCRTYAALKGRSSTVIDAFRTVSAAGKAVTENRVLTAARKRCATPNQSFFAAVAALAFALAVSVKLLPIVLLPLYWKRIRVRDGVLAAVVFGLMYVPFLNHGRIPLGSLGTYVQSFRFNDPVFARLERVVAPQFVAGLAVLAGLLTAVWMARKSVASSDALAWPMAASLLCAPVVYPWYLLWLLPFLRSASTLPLVIWTVSILSTYCIWHLRTLGHPWILPGCVMLLEYGSVAIAGVIVGLRWIKRA